MAQLIDIRMPASEEGTEAVVARWLVQPGDTLTENAPLLEINTDKVTIEIPSPAAGTLAELLVQPGDAVNAGDILGRIESAKRQEARGKGQVEIKGKVGKRKAEKEKEAKTQPRKRQVQEGEREIRLSPIVRRMLSEHRITTAEILGSGRGGRITARDVEQFVEKHPAVTKITPVHPSGSLPSRIMPHSTVRRATARHMVESMLRTAPHVTAVFEADLSAVVAHRAAHKDTYAAKGVQLTYTAYFVHAAAQALLAVPEINSRWHEDALEIFDDANIGIAAATEAGLIVPVLRRAHTLSLMGIAEQLQDLTGKARHGKLKQADLANGTFTITNHGVSGSLIATPIIHQPQSAILAVGKMEKRYVITEKDGVDVPEIKPLAYVTLTIDHRALDGFQANRYLTAFVEGVKRW